MNGSRMTICCSVSENFLVFHQHGLVSPAHSIPRVRFSYMTSPTFSHKPILKTYISHGQVYHSSDFTLQLQGFFLILIYHTCPLTSSQTTPISPSNLCPLPTFLQLTNSNLATHILIGVGKSAGAWLIYPLSIPKETRLSHPTATNCQQILRGGTFQLLSIHSFWNIDRFSIF